MSTGDEGNAETLPPTPSSTPSSTQAAAASPGPPTRAGDDAALVPGDLVARYRIEGTLGRGGMGVVYRARDPDLDRALAIKLVRSRHRGGDRMLREAQAMARLDHPNVVPVFDVGMRGEQVFLVMPFLAGGTLGDWCRKTARPWREVVARYVAAGRGLEAAHKAGIIHRDFKPDNVMLGKKDEVQVVDFGLARADLDSADEDIEPHGGHLAAPLTRAGDLLGTPAYMAPEQLDGKPVDARADQFSFCVSLHEGLYGVRPWAMAEGAGLGDLRSALRECAVRPPPPGRDVPAWLRDALVRGLRRHPAARWPSLGALLDVLERGLRSRLPALGGRTGAMIGVGVVVAALAGGGIWFATSRDSRGSGAARARSGAAAPGVAATGAPFTPRQLTFRGDLGLSALSPDGTQVAALAGDDLVLVSTAADGAIRTLLPAAGDIATMVWSADGQRLLLASGIDTERSLLRIVDVATGTVEKLERATWREATFSGPREIASITSVVKNMRITALDQDLPSTRCPLPGDYDFVLGVTAAGGALFVRVLHHDQTMSLFRTDRSCTAPRLVLDHVPDNQVVIDADGSHVNVVRNLDIGSVLERRPVEGGATVRSRPLPADIERVVGRMPDGRLVASTSRSSWRLARLHDGSSVGAGSSSAALRLSPDRTRVAVIDSRAGESNALRVVPLAQLDARPTPLASDVQQVAWSPDGARLAALVAHDVRLELVVIELATGALVTLPVNDFSQSVELAWLDDTRIAYLRADNATFAWIDRVNQRIGLLFNPDLGWTFSLAVSPADGALAVHWERKTRNGVFLVPPGGEPTVVAPGGELIELTWTPDGSALWTYDLRVGVIDRYVRATGKIERVGEIKLEDHDVIVELAPLAGGDALVQIDRTTIDLVVLE